MNSYDPEKTFNFVHHYKFSDNYLSVVSFGREPTEIEKKKVVQDFEAVMLEQPKDHRMTFTLGILPPLESAS
jgi:hypothetical protein